LAAVTLGLSWPIIRKLLINLLEIAARIAYSGLLKEFEEDKKVSEMIEIAKKELAGRRIT
jgi:hypothetical protein